MESFFLILLFLLFFLFIVGVIVLPAVIKDIKSRNNIVNYDTFMLNYYFALPEDSKSAINSLKVHNAGDILDYIFEPESSTLIFLDIKQKVEFKLTFICADDITYLKLHRDSTFNTSNHIHYNMCSFFIKKLNAKPIDYQKFNQIEATAAK